MDKQITIHHIILPDHDAFMNLLGESEGILDWYGNLLLEKHFSKIAFANGIKFETKRKKIKYGSSLKEVTC